jgi:inosine/xanthosine triphosphatase
MRAILGGTFSCIHKGHLALLSEAVKFDEVHIGLTSDAFASGTKGYSLPSYEHRREGLTRALRSLNFANFRIFPLRNNYGESVTDPQLDAIVASKETEHTVETINSIRKRKGWKALNKIIIPISLGEDYKKISCEAIAKGLIGSDGKRLLPIKVAAGTENPSKLDGAREAASRLFQCKFELLPLNVPSGVSDQPIGWKETMKGAKNRAKNAFNTVANCDYGIGFESGLLLFGGKRFDIVFCAVYGGADFSFGNSMGFHVPDSIFHRIKKEKKSMGEVVSELSGIADIGTKMGAIHFLSNGLLERKEMNRQALLCAFIPRMHPL